MSFYVAAEGELRYRTHEDDEFATLDASSLIRGDTTKVSDPSFKGDTSEYVTYFRDTAGQFIWTVCWSESLSGKDVDDYSLTKTPDGLEIEDEVSFILVDVDD